MNIFNEIWFKDCFNMSLINALINIISIPAPLITDFYYEYEYNNQKMCLKEKMFFENNIFSTMDKYKIENYYYINGVGESKIIDICRKGNYIIIGVDLFYMPCRKDFYLKKHGVHSILISEINEAEKVFYIIEQPFSFSYNYGRVEIKFDDLFCAFSNYHKIKFSDEYYVNSVPSYFYIKEQYPSMIILPPQRIHLDYDEEKKNYVNNLKDKMQFNAIYKNIVSEYLNNINISIKNEKEDGEKIISSLTNIILNKKVENYILSFWKIGEKKLREDVINDWEKYRNIIAKRIYKKSNCDLDIKYVDISYNIVKKEAYLWKFLLG